MHAITFVIGIAPVWEAMRTCLPGGAEMTTRTMTADEGGTEDFTTGEGLRALLRRLHEAGPDAWRTDPVAARLMAFAAEKYEALARKHGLDPWEAATAAFDVMRTRSAREAVDPWGVVTHVPPPCRCRWTCALPPVRLEPPGAASGVRQMCCARR